MKRRPVQSSVLKSAGYSGTGKILELEFATGHVYQYLDVPEKRYKGLLQAASKGKYYNRYIKNEYAFRQLY